MRLTNLVPGRSYKLVLNVSIIAANNTASVVAVHGVSPTIIARENGGAPLESGNDRHQGSSTIEFIAETADLTFQFIEFATATLEGNGTTAQTYIDLQELPYNIQT